MLRPEDIPGFPKGWKIIRSKPITGSNDRLHVVLCEKDGVRPHDTQYVTWKCDREGGGAYWGHYTDDPDEALRDFAQRG